MEIEFRGIRVDNGEMVFGHYFNWFKYGKIIHIIGRGVQNGSVDGFEVIPETVGQYTGLEDKIGVKIYKGDIFNIDSKIYFVEYIYDQCKYVLTTGKGYDTPNCMDLNCDSIFSSYVIGNIHQHKELLE